MYHLTTDDDGHFYVIPLDKQDEWVAWNESENAIFGDPPDWADPVGGSPGLVVFPEYDIV